VLLQLVPDVTLDGCALSGWHGDPARCRWCDAPARGATGWCSLACEDLYRAEHDWGAAHTAALIRDNERCTDCGHGPVSAAEARLLIRAFIPMTHEQAAELWRSQEWLALQLAFSVDVVHRMPPVQSYRSGCHNHQRGLVTLCRRCQDRTRSSIDLRTA